MNKLQELKEEEENLQKELSKLKTLLIINRRTSEETTISEKIQAILEALELIANEIRIESQLSREIILDSIRSQRKEKTQLPGFEIRSSRPINRLIETIGFKVNPKNKEDEEFKAFLEWKESRKKEKIQEFRQWKIAKGKIKIMETMILEYNLEPYEQEEFSETSSLYELEPEEESIIEIDEDDN